MKISTSIIALCVGLAVAGPAKPDRRGPDISDHEDNVFEALEKRKGCSGHRLNTDECQGKRIAPFNSFHNW